MIVPGMFVCSSFLISVCMFIVSKALLISSATVIVRAGGAFGCTLLLRYYLVCVVPPLESVVFCSRVACVCLVCLLLCKEEGSSPVSGPDLLFFGHAGHADPLDGSAAHKIG